MAYAALLSLSQTLEQILECGQPRVFGEEKRIMRSLHEKTSFLLTFLEDSSQNNSETIRCLEGRIRDAAYEAEDMIEYRTLRHIPSESGRPGVISCFWEIISRLQKVIPAFNQCERCVDFDDCNLEQKYEGLEKVIDELDSISDEVVKMDRNRIKDLPLTNSLPASSSKSGSTSKSTIVGLDDDLIHIKDWRTGKPSNREIISIIGMGGTGKTTLARKIYDDPHIDYHFDIRAWTTVSQAYNMQKMLIDLLSSTRDLSHESEQERIEKSEQEQIEKSEQESIEKLAENLYKSLKGRRYLMVMDDVWDTDAWEEVQKLFPDDNNGSRIILTTRLSYVALYTSSFSRIHQMRLLNLKQSWNLLQEKAFGEECCPPEFEVIGKMISKNCKGLPLALVVIGGLLYKAERTQDYWKYIAENVNSAVTSSDNQFMEILSLSYNHLPHHLRPCFLFMGVFPEDQEIFVFHLIKLWVGAGFLKQVRPKSLEEVGEGYMKDLIDRNLILVRKRGYNGQIKTCSIHDLLRDLCLRKAQEEKFNRVVNWNKDSTYPEPTYDERHLSIHSYSPYILEDRDDSPVHSFLYFCRTDTDNLFLSSTVSFPLLRVFDSLTIRFLQFPIQIVRLVNLRYLALISIIGDGYLPASISKLRNLQTLIVYQERYNNTIGLPVEIWNIPNLRHLVLERGFLPHPTGARIGKEMVLLESLQTLSGVINFRCTKKVLEKILNLKKLGISYCYGSRTNWSFYCLENLVHMHQLENLKFLFIPPPYQEFNDTLPVYLAFPPKLRKLTLSGCRISWESMTLVGSLPNLEVLKLKDHAFKGPVWEAKEGEFCRLKYLLIEWNDLENWKANETHFPSLQHLSLRYCYKLIEIPSGIGEIPTLQVIGLYQCCPSAVTSAELIQEEQQSFGNDDLAVHVYSYNELYEHHKGSSFRKSTTGSPILPLSYQ